MACIVKERRNGRLAYRLFWDGYRSWEGTGLRATDKRRATMEAKAAVMCAGDSRGSLRLPPLVPEWEQGPALPPVRKCPVAVTSVPLPNVGCRLFGPANWHSLAVPDALHPSPA